MNFICVGKIVNTHGIKGEVRLISNFERKDFDEIILKGCYPLNPLATYLLLNISEKVAQNERTLFTFLTDDDSNSLKSFIKQHILNEAIVL